MSIMMNPILPVASPELPETIAGNKETGDRSFAEHLDRRMEEAYGGKRDKLGVSETRPAERPAGPTRERRDAVETQQGDDGTDARKAATGLAGVLGDMMDFLQDVAESNLEAPGEWKIELANDELMQQLALAAGMDEEDFAQFMQQMQGADSSIRLVDLLGALSSHFASLEKVEPITVQETEWPMLEAILARMGVASETLEAISAKATTGDGALDLELLLRGLEEIGTAKDLTPVTLSDWESEQMQNLLDLAGVTLEEQNELLPERFLNQALGRDEAGQPVALSVERLADMLRKTLSQVRDSQPKVDLPAFLSRLQQVMTRAEFQNQGVGWTPVVEESVNAVFQKLQEVVDLARIKIEEGQVAEEQLLDEDVAEWFKKVEEKFAELTNLEQGDNFSGNHSAGQPPEETGSSQSPVGQRPTVNFAISQPAHDAAQAVETARGEAAQRPQHRSSPPPQLFQQLSDGVVRGLRNQEHQLVLRLYPQDLGEVKVNLLVRDEHVSVSFNMENGRVKEMLESTMEEFKQSLDQKGFKLGECFVSVGQQDDGGSDLWQRFAMARDTVKATRATLADLPENALYLRADPAGARAGRPDGISLFV